MIAANRRTLLKSGLGAAAIAQSPKRPNILLVISDDHSAPHLGCYGDPTVRTPNLDRFASEGMRFNRAYTTAPQCSPSRASILTGFSPQRVGMTRLHTPLPREHRTYYEFLRQEGYFTGVCGRNHHMDGLQSKQQWHYEIHRRNGMVSMPERVDFLHAGPQEDAPGQFLKFLAQKPKDKPFVFQVGFSDPHMPWTAAEIEKVYRAEDIRLPGSLPDVPEMREMMIKYYAEVTHADMLFGQVMEILDKSGQRENTLVLFMGDNGASIPFGKGTLYQMGWNVPLLARWPGRTKAGAVSDELISGLDLFATFLEAGGARVPQRTESQSFLGLLEGRAHVGREYVYCSRGWHVTLDLIRGLASRTHSFLFNVWPEYRPPRPPRSYDATRVDPKLAAKWARTQRPLYEMYDLRTDPWELDNLAGRPEHKDQEHRLKSALSEWMETTHDFLPPPYINSTRPDADPMRRGN
jgi:arylsulfatase A-like enzyme